MEKLNKLNEILNKMNAKKVLIYDYENKSPFFDYVVIATVNTRQSNAIIGYLKDENILDIERVEGKNTGWTLIDLNDTIIHLFSPEYREYYNFDEKMLGFKQIEMKN